MTKKRHPIVPPGVTSKASMPVMPRSMASGFSDSTTGTLSAPQSTRPLQHVSTKALHQWRQDRTQKLSALRRVHPTWRLRGVGELTIADKEMVSLEQELQTIELEVIRRGKPLQSDKSSGMTEESREFSHSPDYRTVRFDGEEYSFTTQQAKVIEVLHKAYESGFPEVSQHRILEDLGIPSSRLRDTFKRSSAWSKLVITGSKRDMIRLNLPTQTPIKS